LRQADHVPIFGSRGRVSEVVNGKRAIGKAQAKTLGEFFKVSPELFIFLRAGYSTHKRFVSDLFAMFASGCPSESIEFRMPRLRLSDQRRSEWSEIYRQKA